MVLPLLLAMAGVGLAAGAGKSFLDDYMEEASEDAQAQRYRDALSSARMETGGVGAMGPELPTVSYDPMKIGEYLVQSGDPAGLPMILQAQQAQAQGGAAEQKLAGQLMLEEYKQGQQNLRHQRDIESRERIAAANMQKGFMPHLAAMYSPEWNALSDEAIGLTYGANILRDFQESLSQYGTETWSATAGRLGAQRAQLMNMLRQQLKTGTIDEGTLMLFDTMLPDPTKWSGDLTGVESGKLEAAAEQFNMLIRQHNARRGTAVGLPEVNYIMTRNMAPAGTVPVYEIESGTAAPTQVEREAELRENLEREAEERQGISWWQQMQRRLR